MDPANMGITGMPGMGMPGGIPGMMPPNPMDPMGFLRPPLPMGGFPVSTTSCAWLMGDSNAFHSLSVCLSVCLSQPTPLQPIFPPGMGGFPRPPFADQGMVGGMRPAAPHVNPAFFLKNQWEGKYSWGRGGGGGWYLWQPGNHTESHLPCVGRYGWWRNGFASPPPGGRS